MSGHNHGKASAAAYRYLDRLAVKSGRAELYDVVVIGSGGAGLTAALASQKLGARTLLLERSELIGGTYSYSGGLAWVPNNSQMRALGLSDSEEEAIAHIRELGGGRHNESVLRSFVGNAARAIDWLESVGVPFEVVPGNPDVYAERTGGKREGRFVSSPVFYPQEHLDEEWAKRADASPHYAGLAVSWQEIAEWGGLSSIASWDWDMLAGRVARDGRGFGGATTGYLLAACLRAGVEIRCGWMADELIRRGERVSGVVAHPVSGGKPTRIHAEWGVVLATGGYDASKTLQAQYDPHFPIDTVGVSTIDGSGITMALEIGAAFQVLTGQLMTPCIHIPGEELNGKPLYRITPKEPAFPGGIVVNRAGNRFCDESFAQAICHGMTQWDAVRQEYPNGKAYLVFDEEWKKLYALGPVGPGEVPSWLPHADTAEELAALIGVDGTQLAATIERFNGFAPTGEDPDFHRGSTEFGRKSGDRRVSPNPTMRALKGRLYAVEILPSSVGTDNGLVYDANGQVLHVRGHRIPGLYAVGNSGANLGLGLWYNAGASNALALTFGYLAAVHMAQQAGRPGLPATSSPRPVQGRQPARA